MGLLDAITGSILLKYKVDTDQAKAKVKELSGEQKKAAKAHVEELEAQGKASDTLFQKYAKGAAIIGAAYLVAKDGLDAYTMRTRLTAGAAGVDIDKLSEAYGGLKTQTELLTLAQAGHQGAWKLTTSQIALLVDGMRALEKKGYESGKVFERFTEVIKKGKLEGLDEFGLSLKSTGDQTKDLQVLMKALGSEVADVGGNFDKAGDSAQRSLVKMEDGLTRVRVAAGKAVSVALDLAASLGRGAAAIAFGPLPGAGNNELAAEQYANRLQLSRGNFGVGGSGLNTTLLARPSSRDVADAKAIDAFRSQVLRRVTNTVQLDDALARLPDDWQAADPGLAERVDRLRTELIGKMVTGGGVSNLKNALTGAIDNIKRDAARPTKSGRGGGSRPVDVRVADLEPLVGEAVRRALGFAEYVGARADANRANAANDNAAARSGLTDAMDEATSAADALQSSWQAALDEQSRKDSWLAAVFGPIDEFDRYTEALTFLGQTSQKVTGEIYSMWASNEAITTAAIKRMIGAEIAAEGKRLWARGLAGVLTGAFNVASGNPAGFAQLKTGGAMIAGAVAIGAVARSLSGGDTSTPSAGASSGSSRPNTGGDGSGGSGVTNQTLILTQGFVDESPRQRERHAYRALTRTTTVYRPPGRAA